jgi:hypothetical protein
MKTQGKRERKEREREGKERQRDGNLSLRLE